MRLDVLLLIKVSGVKGCVGLVCRILGFLDVIV